MAAVNTGKYRAEKSAPTGDPRQAIPKEDSSEVRHRKTIENNAIDEKYGFRRVQDYLERTGFLLNMHSNEIMDEDKKLHACMDYYFMEEDGKRFKVSQIFKPYFYILLTKENIQEVIQFLQKKFAGTIHKIESVLKEDLDMPNHLIGLKQRYFKLTFLNQTDLIKVRREILSNVRKNREKQKGNSFYTDMLTKNLVSNGDFANVKSVTNHMGNIIDIREYDVPYHVRVSIDMKIFCGSWYDIKTNGPRLNPPPIITKREDLIERPDPIVLAFDIETTKLPLKFPDSATDQIMMISYMIDGLGFLIINRDIITSDIKDFEYTPKPEFEGIFKVFNEKDEKALLLRFFTHILEIRPHIFVTYNGDFFDWPFVETRAAVHGFDMKQEIGFVKGTDGIYASRPAIHMDCLCWVKRDSYLPVGSQNLKAVAKAKLRYDPVELDPEDMCQLAIDNPEVLSNYSVSDAVATYYLYMKYVHPFIFALCTIIPTDPDEVLRKGSGTLCEALLMVEAFHGNIIFPNKQESELNKLTDSGHLLHQETYVGGHVEALESGVFRADIPCRFRMVADAFQQLIDNIDKALSHAIEIEEAVPLNLVTNFEEVKEEIVTKLQALRDQPYRLENPIIYHLDVGAMYPNIILTNRLQPCAMVDESICAACDFNRPGATCQRNMSWMWRAEYMPATRNEYHRIQLQLETEKFAPKFPSGPQRAFHQLTREEQAEYEKKRLSDYCRKAYKKVKITKMEEKTTTICQKENSFYVDTVRAFRDRRYEYKGLNKKAKQAVAVAVASKNAAEIKSAKNREILYDSLQLAHKCILNSFYGYVMRRGARWHSMEMAGIVCYTGAHIIMKAREIIEKVGRPLELDTDGIWCVLPASFPENFEITTNHEKKKKFTISYPNTILNLMVKEHFTNDQYHDLVNPKTLEYTTHNENSIFFEVDGPYLGMVLPASKEEGKKLKKRYAVFNFDGSLAELKGFEVKRRGELQLIKIFQSSVFESFLKGDTLETCYASVAKVADYWLDVLYSKGKTMPDSELFELISENRSMSRKLEEYGQQKSTSISTAKRLAEFLGDQMVKDKGLACRFIISKKPDGAPVTERAIPLAIFQAEEAVQKHYLRKWLKDSTIAEFDIREILDWDYYIERLGGAIQKIITIPAAMQGLSNPVPRIKHPDWLHKKVLEKTDIFKQRKINDMFKSVPKSLMENNQNYEEIGEDASDNSVVDVDIEDIAGKSSNHSLGRPVVTTNKRKRVGSFSNDKENEEMMTKSWKEALGPSPPLGKTKDEVATWIVYQKKKWEWQAKQRSTSLQQRKKARQNNDYNNDNIRGGAGVVRSGNMTTLGGFLKRAQRSLLDSPWQIIQLATTNSPGEFKLWALVGQELHQIKLTVPRIFYANLRAPKETDVGVNWRKCNRILPRCRPVYNLYRYSVPESMFLEQGVKINKDLKDPSVEGIYETQVSLLFRAMLEMGCVCSVNRSTLKSQKDLDTFSLEQLNFLSVGRQPYLSKKHGCTLRHIYLYHHKAASGPREMYGLFMTPIKKVLVIVVDSVRTNLMPNMNTLYTAERIVKIQRTQDDDRIPPPDISFEIKVESDLKQVYRLIQRALQSYKDEKKGPSFLAIQSDCDLEFLQGNMPELSDFPQVKIHVQDVDTLYNTLEWQRNGAKAMIRHYLNSERLLELMAEQSRYFHLPLGNMPADPTIFGADLFYARFLQKNNFLLWCSNTDKPDLGGNETNDARLIAECQEGSSEVCNNSGCYSSISVELDVDSLAINTLLQSHHVNDIEGTASTIAFDAVPTVSIDNMVSGAPVLPAYDDTALCSEAFKVLKEMVNAWLRDVSIYRNIFADFQIVHFYRWLRSTKSLLFDPALLKTLHVLMKKLFMQLVAEFKRLGSIIIFANFNKIIVCTKKHTIANAIGYVEFVVKSIRNKELFHSIEISYNKCWEYLLWLDIANHGGVQGILPFGLGGVGESQITEGAATEPQSSIEGSLGENQGKLKMNFNLIEHLPEEGNCRRSCEMTIAGYVTAIYKQAKLMETPEDNVEPRLDATQSQRALLGVGANATINEYAEKFISTSMSQTLFELTERMNKRLPQMPVPALTGGIPGNTMRPALEFVKAICQILGLDSALEDTVYSLKRNMLRLIGVGEFSEIAIWRDPSVSYVLPSFICKTCNHCRDIDLGRDKHIKMDENNRSWYCPLCKANYDTAEIENLLLDIITRKMVAYNLQDLQCNKCGQIKMENLTTYCSCAGDFKCILSHAEFVKLLNDFKKLADTFYMLALQDTINHIFKYL